MAYTVYVLTCKANGKKYVGMTSREPKKRWLNGKGYGNNKYISEDILKYGWESFEKQIVSEGMREEEAALLERKLIKEYGSANEKRGYNRTLGGETLGGSYWIEETNNLRSISKMGEKNPNYGKPGTMLGKKMKPESVAKMVEKRKELLKDQKELERFRNNLAESRKKIQWTPEKRERQKEAARKAMSKKCICITTGEMFRSATEAAKKIGTTVGCVARACRGERPTVLGLEFKYI